jgi:hypothetical protein
VNSPPRDPSPLPDLSSLNCFNFNFNCLNYFSRLNYYCAYCISLCFGSFHLVFYISHFPELMFASKSLYISYMIASVNILEIQMMIE